MGAITLKLTDVGHRTDLELTDADGTKVDVTGVEIKLHGDSEGIALLVEIPKRRRDAEVMRRITSAIASVKV